MEEWVSSLRASAYAHTSSSTERPFYKKHPKLTWAALGVVVIVGGGLLVTVATVFLLLLLLIPVAGVGVLSLIMGFVSVGVTLGDFTFPSTRWPQR